MPPLASNAVENYIFNTKIGNANNCLQKKQKHS